MNTSEPTPEQNNENLRRVLAETLGPAALTDADIDSLLNDVTAAPLSDARLARIVGNAMQTTNPAHSDRTIRMPRTDYTKSDRPEATEIVMRAETKHPNQSRDSFGTNRFPRGSVAALMLSAVCLLAVLMVTARPQLPSGDDDPPTILGKIEEVLTENVMVAKAYPAVFDFAKAVIGDELETGPRERKRMQLPDGSMLYMNENTKAHVQALRSVRVESGEVFVEVAPRVDDSNRVELFYVKTPSRTVTALGTKFAVNADVEKTDVLVTQGKVKVNGVDDIFPAGHFVRFNSRHMTTTPAPRASAALDWTEDLLATAASIVPKSEYCGGALFSVDPNGQESRLSLRKYHVDVHIEDGFARTTIDQTYFNHTWQRLDGTFKFPLPADASLSRLAMYVNGKLMEGGMAEREHARNTFEEIMHTKKDPALLEWVDGSTFKMRVFPLEPRRERRIVISYTQRLASAYGKTHYRFPAGHNLDTVRDWSTQLRVKGGENRTWHSPSHVLKAKRRDSDLILSASARHALLNRDLVLEFEDEWKNVADQSRTKLTRTRHEDHQYLMLRHRPELKAELSKPRRNWVFLFESSGDRNPVLARVQVEVIRTLLKNAEHSDTFSVITAATRPDVFRDKRLPCKTKHINAAIAHLEQTHLVGALDLEHALEACEPMFETDKPAETHLVHVGSGLPALGETSEKSLAEKIPESVRYVGVGVGKRWSRQFMRAAANRTGGYFTQINPDEKVGWRAFELLSVLNAPRLLNVGVVDNAEKLTFLNYADAVAHGEEICAIARFDNDTDLPESIVVSGELNGDTWQQTIPVETVTEKADYLPRSWARLEIDRLVAAGAAANRDEIIALSNAMYVMSPFTSLLVLENEQMYAQYKIDFGRKDHWALYNCPATIPVVHEPYDRLFASRAEADDSNPVSTIRRKERPSVYSFAEPADKVQYDTTVPSPANATWDKWTDNYWSVQALPWGFADGFADDALLINPAPQYGGMPATESSFEVLDLSDRVSKLDMDLSGDGVLDEFQLGALYKNIEWNRPRLSGERLMRLQGDVTLQPMDDLGIVIKGNMSDRDITRRIIRDLEDLSARQRDAIDGPAAVRLRALQTMESEVELRRMLGLTEDLSELKTAEKAAQRRRARRGGTLPPTTAPAPAPTAGSRNIVQKKSRPKAAVPKMALPVEEAVSNAAAAPEAATIVASDGAQPGGEGQLPAGAPPVIMNLQVQAPAEAKVRLLEQPPMSRYALPVVPGQSGQASFSRGLNSRGFGFGGESARAGFAYPGPGGGGQVIGGNLAGGGLGGGGVDARFGGGGGGGGFGGVAGAGGRRFGGQQFDAGRTDRWRELPVLGFGTNLEALDFVAHEARGRFDRGGSALPTVREAEGFYFTPFDGEQFGDEHFGVQDLTRHYFRQPVRQKLKGANTPVTTPVQFLGDLMAHAPGLNSTMADALAVWESESKTKPQSGKIESAARKLIDKARDYGWEEVNLGIGEAAIKVRYDGTGRYTWTRTISEGLREEVTCDGTDLWHVYRELGLAATRRYSRFHRSAMSRILPWLLAPAEELAIGADVIAVNDHTVAITPIRPKAQPASGKPQREKTQDANTAVHLVFAKDGRLRERRLVNSERKSLLRITFNKRGQIRVLDRSGRELSKTTVARLKVTAPGLAPETDGLVVLPLPYRSGRYVLEQASKQPERFKGAKGDYRQWLERDALALIVGDILDGHWARASHVLKTRFFDRNDRRDGLFVLMNQYPRSFHPPTSAPSQAPVNATPLQRFVRHIASGDISAEFDADAFAEGSLLRNIAVLRNTYYRWQQGLATRDRTRGQIRTELREALDVVGSVRSPAIGWALLRAIQPHLSHAEFHAEFAAAAKRFEGNAQLAWIVRHERAKELFAANRSEPASKLYADLLTQTLKAGFVPPIEKSIRDQFVEQRGQRIWSELCRNAAYELVDHQLLRTAMLLSVQLRNLGDVDLADDIFDRTVSRLEPDARPDVALLAIERMRQINEQRQADELLTSVLNTEWMRDSAPLWRYGAALAEERGRKSLALERLERAVSLEFAARPEVIDLQKVRTTYTDLLGRYEAIVDASATLEQTPPQSLAKRVMRAADQWRAMEDDDTQACQTAGRILTKVGSNDLGWDYVTTPLATRPGSASWRSLGQILVQQGEIDKASNAYERAFAFERTDPTILYEHATALKEHGRVDAAEKVAKKILQGQWQPRFNSIKANAQTLIRK